MKKEDLIIRWLDNNLDEEELKAFKELDASSDFLKIDAAVKQLKAPEFDAEESLARLKAALPVQQLDQHKHQWKKYISSIAAVLVVAICLYFTVFNTNEVNYLAKNGEKTEFILPDNSEVILNAGSHISFEEKNWSDNRSLQLEGEAYFKVAKGKTFTVKTTKGDITVLGTEFTVNVRPQLFEVTCFEGVVDVIFNGKSMKLMAGHHFLVYNEKVQRQEISITEPSWIHTKSSFTSIPFNEVVEELERQYNITVTGESTKNEMLFTGSFTHENLETALQAITIPLNLSYELSGTKVVLKTK